jgi:hypothetical protein
MKVIRDSTTLKSRKTLFDRTLWSCHFIFSFPCFEPQMPWPKYVWNACVMGEWLTQSLYYSLQIRFVFIILLPSLNLCTKLNPVNYTFQFYAINTRGKYETNFLRVNLNLNIFKNNNTAVKLPSKFFEFLLTILLSMCIDRFYTGEGDLAEFKRAGADNWPVTDFPGSCFVFQT